MQYAADRGHNKAQFLMGDCYENGYGVVGNDAIAEEWYKKAGAQGHAEAQYRLGMMYTDIMDIIGIVQYNEEMDNSGQIADFGNTVIYGAISALTQLTKAPSSSKDLDRIYNETSAKAKKWLSMAAKQGHKKAEDEYIARFK